MQNVVFGESTPSIWHIQQQL